MENTHKNQIIHQNHLYQLIVQAVYIYIFAQNHHLPQNSQNFQEIYGADLEIFPNPSHGTFELRVGNHNLSKFQVEIFDMLGRRYSLETLRDQTIEIREKGTYLVRIFDKSGNNITKKVIVQ